MSAPSCVRVSLPRIVTAVFLAALTCYGTSAGPAPRAAEAPPAQSLPLREVVLFSSGVGYFGRAGRLDGSATIPLSFRSEQVNDILKSLVLFDSSGSVLPVGYALGSGATGVSRVSESLGQSVTLGGLLRPFQGVQLRLAMGAETVEGRLVSVSTRSVPVKEGPAVQLEVLNLLGTGGLRSVPLDQVTEVKLLDERLDRQLRDQLELLARGLDDARRSVELHFGGNGAREVRAGYLQEMPVWKTSYRLVLDDKKAPYLQGWANVENTTDEDWKDVRLKLVAGRPISFIEDLYQPLYVPRPVVQAQVVGSPTPQTYGETLADGQKNAAATPPSGGFGGGGFGGAMGGYGGLPGAPDQDRKVSFNFRAVPLRSAVNSLFSGTGLQFSVDPNVPNVPVTLSVREIGLQVALRLLIRQAATSAPGLTFSKDADIFVIKVRHETPGVANEQAPPEYTDTAVSAEMLRNSLTSQARGASLGDLFQYVIKDPVSLPRQQAAMVPIISDSIGGAKLSIFDPAADSAHALNAFRLKNTTSLHLAGGPITVFQSGGYAGDAEITDLQPGEERLLSYAVDLDLVVGAKDSKATRQVVTVSAHAGVLHVTRKERREIRYSFRNKSDQPKIVLIQLPIEPEYQLVKPEKPDEKTSETYRFRLDVPARNSAEFLAVQERPLHEQIILAGVDTGILKLWAFDDQAPQKLRASLKQLLGLRGKVVELQSQRARLEEELKTIDLEQARIRQNMMQLDRNSGLYQQYVKKLTDQEARIEKLREEIAKLRDAETKANEDVGKFVETLDTGM